MAGPINNGVWSCTSNSERTWMGFGWKLHFGRLFVKTTNINDKQIVEMPDGSRHVGYKYNGLMTKYITKDQWIIDYTTNPFTVTLTNGTKIYYGQSAPLDINSRYQNYNLYLATKIEDAQPAGPGLILSSHMVTKEYMTNAMQTHGQQ